MKKKIALSVFAALALPMLIAPASNAVEIVKNEPNRAGIVIQDVFADAGESFNLALLDDTQTKDGWVIESVNYSTMMRGGSNHDGLGVQASEDKSVLAVKVNSTDDDKTQYRLLVGYSMTKTGIPECNENGCISSQQRAKGSKWYEVKVHSTTHSSSSDLKTNDKFASSDLKLGEPETVVEKSTNTIPEKVSEVSKPVVENIVKTEQPTIADKSVKTTTVKESNRSPVIASKALTATKQANTHTTPENASEQRTAPVGKVNKPVVSKVEVEPLVVAKKVSDDAPKATKTRVVEYKPVEPAKTSPKVTVLPATSLSTSDDDAMMTKDSKESRVSTEANWNQVDTKESVIGSVPDAGKNSTHEMKPHKSIGSIPSDEGSWKRDTVGSSPTNQEMYESSERATQAFNKLLVPAWVFAGSVAALAIGFLVQQAVKLAKRNKS